MLVLTWAGCGGGGDTPDTTTTRPTTTTSAPVTETTAAELTAEEQAYLELLGDNRSAYDSDESALAAGRAVCADLEDGNLEIDPLDVEQVNAVFAAPRTLCPEFENLVQEFPQ